MLDIAKALNMSKGTVSLALRWDVRISLATREAVRAKAEEMGYRRDPTLSALAESRWRGKAPVTRANLGFLTGEEDAAAIKKKVEFQTCYRHADQLG